MASATNPPAWDDGCCHVTAGSENEPLAYCDTDTHTEADILARWRASLNGHINGKSFSNQVTDWLLALTEHVKSWSTNENIYRQKGVDRNTYREWIFSDLKNLPERQPDKPWYQPPPEMPESDIDTEIWGLIDAYLPASKDDPIQNGRKRRGKSAMAVKPVKVEWLWPGYIPLGKLCDFQGDPGQGKSAITADIAAIISAGLKWPTGEDCSPGGVIMVSGEDDLADTIVPRLIAAGANRERIHTHTILDEELFELPRDLDLLRSEIRELKARLVILDPIDCFVADEIEVNKNQSIRKLLARLAKLADEERLTVIVVRHLNKDAKTKTPMYRGGGSIGMNAASRAVFILGPSPADKDLHVLAYVKGNNGPPPSSQGYRLQAVPLADYPDISIVKVNWVGPVQYEAWQLLESPDVTAKVRELSDKVKEIVVVLRQLFSGGVEMDATDAEQEVQRQVGQVAKSTIWKAKIEAGIKSKRKGFAKDWLWYMPEKMFIDSQDTNLDDDERF